MTMTTSTEKAKPNAPLLAELDAVPGKNTMAKVMADISFLRDRIAQLQSHRNPNAAVLQTYTAMLARREMALALMQDAEASRRQQ